MRPTCYTRTVNRIGALVVVALCATSMVGCNGCNKTKPAMLADAAPPPSFDKPAKAPDPRFASDPFWLAAASDDPLDLAALGEHEGAEGLLEALEQGGGVGLVALHALPYTDDSELALRRLGEIALQTKDQTQLDVLGAIRAIAQDMAARGEPLDPGGPEACIEALVLIAKDGSPKQNRLEARAALFAFASRGAVSPSRIPATDG